MRMLAHSFILPALLTVTLAQAADDTSRTAAGVMTPEEQLLQTLDTSYELLQLDTGSDRFSLLFRPAMAPTAKGNLLLLPDTGVADAWLEQTRALIDYLPEHGWNVLIAQPPAPPDPTLPERTLPVMKRLAGGQGEPPSAADAPPATPPAASEENASSEGGNTESPAVEPPYPDQLNNRLQSAWAELSQRGSGKQKLVMGIGSSASWAAQFALSQGEDVSLVMLNPRPAQQAPEGLESLLEKLDQRKVVDLYYHPLPGYPNAEPDAQQRRLLARRLGMAQYHQSRLPGVFRGWQTDMPWLTRQVRGILERVFQEQLTPLQELKQPDLSPPQPPGTRPAGNPGSI